MYLFYDTETNGLPKNDNYKAPASDTYTWPLTLQLAYALYNDRGELVKEVVEYVNRDIVINEDAQKVHQITYEDLNGGNSVEDVFTGFAKACSDVTLVAHNYNFDSKVVGAEFHRLGMTPLENKYICTMLSTTKFCNIKGFYGIKWPSLQELHTKLFGEGFEDAHDAMVDVNATVRCFFELKKKGVL
jgi:DNA polymerase III subunit epsilon